MQRNWTRAVVAGVVRRAPCRSVVTEWLTRSAEDKKEEEERPRGSSASPYHAQRDEGRDATLIACTTMLGVNNAGRMTGAAASSGRHVH